MYNDFGTNYSLRQITFSKKLFQKNLKGFRQKTLTGAQSISSTQAITLADIIIESPDSSS